MATVGTPHPKVAIIGGGWSGLTCALRLAQAGLKPVVYESAPEPGGRARRARVQGAFRDNGQHLMLSGCHALAQLLADIGVTLPHSTFSYTDGLRTLRLTGRPGQLGLVLSVIHATGFRWGERWSLMRALLALHHAGWQTGTDVSVAAWLRAQHQPETLIQNFWVPLALAIMNTPIETAAMARLAAVMRDTLGAGSAALRILQPGADLSQSIVEPLVAAIIAAGGQVICGQRVKAVRPENDGYHVAHQDSAGFQRYDRVVLAVPPWSLTHIDLPFETVSLATRFGAQPLATVYLGFAEDVRLPTALVQLRGPTEQDARVWAMDRRHCGEPGVIAVSLSAEGAWRQLDQETLAERCALNLQPIIGPAACHWRRVLLVHNATPSASVTARISKAERRPRHGLHLIGDWTHPEYPATLEAAVHSGNLAAQQIYGE